MISFFYPLFYWKTSLHLQLTRFTTNNNFDFFPQLAFSTLILLEFTVFTSDYLLFIVETTWCDCHTSKNWFWIVCRCSHKTLLSMYVAYISHDDTDFYRLIPKVLSTRIGKHIHTAIVLYTNRLIHSYRTLAYTHSIGRYSALSLMCRQHLSV